MKLCNHPLATQVDAATFWCPDCGARALGPKLDEKVQWVAPDRPYDASTVRELLDKIESLERGEPTKERIDTIAMHALRRELAIAAEQIERILKESRGRHDGPHPHDEGYRGGIDQAIDVVRTYVGVPV